MTDKEYELTLKNVDCCQNCIHFILGIHIDGCQMGWCHRGTLDAHYRDDICKDYEGFIDSAE